MELFVVGCSSTWSTRPTSCYLIDGHIMFDCGEGTAKEVLRHFGEEKLSEVDNIFITHLHADHIFSINQYILAQMRNNKSGIKKLTIYGLQGLKDAIYKLMSFAKPSNILNTIDNYVNIVELNELNKEIKIDNYSVMPFLLQHGDFDNLGYVISNGEFSLGYMGDACYDDKLLEMVESCSVLICDVSSMRNEVAHMGLEGYNKLKANYKEKQFYAVHCSNEIYDNAKNLGLKILKNGKTYKFIKGKLSN